MYTKQQKAINIVAAVNRSGLSSLEVLAVLVRWYGLDQVRTAVERLSEIGGSDEQIKTRMRDHS